MKIEKKEQVSEFQTALASTSCQTFVLPHRESLYLFGLTFVLPHWGSLYLFGLRTETSLMSDESAVFYASLPSHCGEEKE